MKKFFLALIMCFLSIPMVVMPIKAVEVSTSNDKILSSILRGDQAIIVTTENGIDVTTSFLEELNNTNINETEFNILLNKFKVSSISKEINVSDTRQAKTVKSNKIVNFYENSIRLATVTYSASVNYTLSSSGSISSVNSAMSYSNVSFQYKSNSAFSFYGRGNASKTNSTQISYTDIITLLNMGSEKSRITYAKQTVSV